MKEECYYIGATQNAVIRLDKNTPEEVLGLYTDGLKVCLGIVLYGKEGQISLIHYDGTIGNQEMKSEFEKVQSLQKWEIWRNSSDTTSEQHMKEIQTLISSDNCEKWTSMEPSLMLTRDGSFYVNRRNKEVHTDHYNNPTVKFIPNKEFRHSINMLNHLFGNKAIDEQYDGKQWSNYSHKLDDIVSLDDPQGVIEHHGRKLLSKKGQKKIRDHWQKKVEDYKHYNKYQITPEVEKAEVPVLDDTDNQQPPQNVEKSFITSTLTNSDVYLCGLPSTLNHDSENS